jgi:hypothetical protein
LEESKTLPVKFGWGFIREGDSIAHAAHIMPQTGEPRPKSDAATVSYQITRALLAGNSGEEPFAIKDKQILEFQRIQVFPDYFAKFPKPGCICMGTNSPDGNRGDEAAKNLKLSRSHFAVQDLVGVRLGHEREECSLCANRLNARRKVRAAVA